MADPDILVLDISELSALTGLAPSALRFYERRGLLTPIGRAGGKRVYRAGAVQQVALIDLLKISGFTLPEIGVQLGLSRHTIADYVKQIYRKLNVSSRAEAALEAQRLGLFGR